MFINLLAASKIKKNENEIICLMRVCNSISMYIADMNRLCVSRMKKKKLGDWNDRRFLPDWL